MQAIERRLVIVIIGFVVLSITIYLFLSVALRTRQRARAISTRAQLIAYQTATTNYFARIGRWPQSAIELVSNTAGLVFIDPPPPWTDAWKRPVIFTPFSQVIGSGSVLGYGRDGKPGGTDTDTDIEVRFP